VTVRAVKYAIVVNEDWILFVLQDALVWITREGNQGARTGVAANGLVEVISHKLADKRSLCMAEGTGQIIHVEPNYVLGKIVI